MGQSLFKKHSKFQNFEEIFYCGMTRLRNMNGVVFLECRHTKSMGQSLIKKYSKFQNFEEILYCIMTRFRNVKLGGNIKTSNYFKKETYELELF